MSMDIRKLLQIRPAQIKLDKEAKVQLADAMDQFKESMKKFHDAAEHIIRGGNNGSNGSSNGDNHPTKESVEK